MQQYFAKSNYFLIDCLNKLTDNFDKVIHWGDIGLLWTLNQLTGSSCQPNCYVLLILWILGNGIFKNIPENREVFLVHSKLVRVISKAEQFIQ